MIVLALMSCTAYSQDSTLCPDRVIATSQDTLFCWGQSKTRILAKTVIKSSYCDSISKVQQEEIFVLDSMIADQYTIIKALETRDINMLKIVEQKNKQIVGLKIIINNKDGEIRKQKGLKWIGFIAAGFLGALYIVK